MFSNIGWGEIFFILVIGLIIIGPERLPGVVKDVRAALYAARKAINNAKRELDGELGEGFEEFRKPLNTVTEYAALGPRRAVAKVFFDSDEDFLNDFDPRQVLADPDSPAGLQPKRGARKNSAAPKTTSSPPHRNGGDDTPAAGGFSWADIT